MNLNVKQAVRIAADYVYDMESMNLSENVDEMERSSFLQGRRFSIEGTRFNEGRNCWEIEVGFTRPWDRSKPNAIANLGGSPSAAGDRRTDKTVVISDDTSEVISYGD